MTASPFRVAPIILATSLMAYASGIAYAFVPIRLLADGHEPWVAATMTPAVAFGGLAGCFVVGPLLRHLGIRLAFALIFACISLSLLGLAATQSAPAWIVARTIYGLAVNTMFVTAQTWMHDLTGDRARGRVITLFYISYVVAMGLGALSIRFVDVAGPVAPLLGAAACLAAILPVAFNGLPTPPPPGTVSFRPLAVWRISPVGLVGMLAVGGMTMTLLGFTPIFLVTSGHDKGEVGLAMFAMQVGFMAVQLPMGWISDRTDRRHVLIATCLLAATMSAVVFGVGDALGLMGIAVALALWHGANETVYPVSNALANDRARREDFVMLSATQLFAWSLSAFLVPLAATALVGLAGIKAFMPLCGAIALAFAAFVAWRIRQRPQAAKSA
jgi:MFS family permease